MGDSSGSGSGSGSVSVDVERISFGGKVCPCSSVSCFSSSASFGDFLFWAEDQEEEEFHGRFGISLLLLLFLGRLWFEFGSWEDISLCF